MKGYQRAQRRIRARRLQKNKAAVSPVIATLLLILIAVAAAAALYLWISGWQAGASGKIGNPTTHYSLSLGGSASVYPVSQQAITWFEQNESGVAVANSAGGSSAGLISLCADQISIAQLDRPVLSSDPSQCASNVVQTTIGYDAVAPVIPQADSNGIVSLSSQEALMAYWLNGGQPSLASGSANNPIVGCDATVHSGGIGAACNASGAPVASAGSIFLGLTSREYVPAYWGIQAPSITAGIGCSGNLGCLSWSDLPQQACYDPNIATESAGPGGNLNADGLWYVPSAAGSAATSVGIGAEPQEVAYDSANGDLFAINHGTDSVSVVSGSSNSVFTTVSLPATSPRGIFYDPVTSATYPQGVVLVSDSASVGQIYAINPSTYVVTTISIGAGDASQDFAYDPSTGDLYITAQTPTSELNVINAASLALVATYSPAGLSETFGITYDAATGLLYTAENLNPTGYVAVINPTTGAIVTTIATNSVSGEGYPQGLTLDPTNGDLYVANAWGGVAVINPATDAVVTSVNLGTNSEPVSATYDPVNQAVYISKFGDAGNSTQITAISGVTNTAVATYSLGGAYGPEGLVFDSATGTVFVSDYSADALTEVDPANGYAGPCANAWDQVGASTGAIHVYGRADTSDVGEAFVSSMLGLVCGTTNELSACGFPYSTGTAAAGEVNVDTGNAALLHAEETDANALGYMSYELAVTPYTSGGGGATSSGTTSSSAGSAAGCGSGSGVCFLAFAQAQLVPTVGTSGGYTKTGSGSSALALVPTLGNIQTGVQAGYGTQASGAWSGWRPFEYVTYGQPTGEEDQFIQFVTQPGTNVLLMNENYFISYTLIAVNTPAPA